jgi:hypothetical protein
MIIEYQGERAAVLAEASAYYLAVVDSGTTIAAPKDAAVVIEDDLRQAALNAAYALEGDDEDEMVKQYARTMQKWLKRIKAAGKTCKGCDEFKPLRAFGRRLDSEDGLMRICKACTAEANAKKYLARHKD